MKKTILKKGMISLAAASLLATGVYAATTNAIVVSSGVDVGVTSSVAVSAQKILLEEQIADVISNGTISFTLDNGAKWVSAIVTVKDVSTPTTGDSLTATYTSTDTTNYSTLSAGLSTVTAFGSNTVISSGTATDAKFNSTGETLTVNLAGIETQANKLRLEISDMSLNTSSSSVGVPVTVSTTGTASGYTDISSATIANIKPYGATIAVLSGATIPTASLASQVTPPKITIAEVIAGSIMNGSTADEIAIELPTGFNFVSNFNISSVTGESSVTVAEDTTAVDETGKSRVDINVTNTTGSTSAETLTIELPKIFIPSDATIGDLTAKVSVVVGNGTSTVSQDLKLATIAAKGTTSSFVEASGTTATVDYNTLFIGRTYDQGFGTSGLEDDKLKVAETSTLAMAAGGTLTLTLSSGAAFYSTSHTTGTTGTVGESVTTVVVGDETIASTSKNIATYTIATASTATAAGSVTFDFNDLDLTDATAGDLTVTVGGNSGVTTQTVKIAELMEATSTAVTSKPTTATVGSQVTLADIEVSENAYAALEIGYLNVYVAEMDENYLSATSATVKAFKADGTDVTTTIFGTSTPAVTVTTKGVASIKTAAKSTSTTGPVTVVISGLVGTLDSDATGDVTAVVGGAKDTTDTTPTSNEGAKATKASGVVVAGVVSKTVPAVNTDGITDADGDLTTKEDKSLSATLTVAGNDTGKVGSIFVFTNKGNYITSTGVTTTPKAFSPGVDGIVLGTEDLDIFVNQELPSELRVGEVIYVGYGAGFTTELAVENLNAASTAVIATTLTADDLAIVEPVVLDTTTPSSAFSGLEMGTGEETAASATVSNNGTGANMTISVEGAKVTVYAGSDALYTITFTSTGYSITSHVEGSSFKEVGDSYTVTVTDANGNPIEIAVTETEATEGTEDPITSTIALSEGWNLLGNNSASTIDTTGMGEISWSFDNGAADVWAKDPTAVASGQGYWLKVTDASSGIELTKVDTEATAPAFTAGSWALKACGSAKTIADIKNDNNGATLVWSYNGDWSNDDTTTVEAGQGYWVK